MAKWIPGVATFGLICLMVLPAPGIWGVLIGGICVVAIIGSVLMWALDSVLSRGLARYTRWRTRRPAAPRRARHAGSGMAQRVPTRNVAGKRA